METKEEYVKIREEIRPVIKELNELSITFEDIDKHRRILKAKKQLRTFLLELYNSLKDN